MSKLVRVSTFQNSTRFTRPGPNAADGEYYTFNFTKESATSLLVVEAVIPTKENYNDGAFLYVAIDGNRKYTGVIETPMDSNQVQQCLIKQTWTGIGIGTKTLRFGWQEVGNTAQSPWIITNPNSSDEARNRQSGTTFVIWEVEP